MAENSTQVEESVEQATSVEDSKPSPGNPDFEIKVGDVSYPVHQNILISSSEYFRGMLAHDTGERQNGFVEIKEIDSQTMKLCIDFMYGGNIDVTMETAKTLLPAAEFLQLTELHRQSVNVLECSLNSGNCITVLKLARAYNCNELAERAFDIFKEEFKMESFEYYCELDKEGIKLYISDLDMEVAWDGIINWIKLDVENRSSDIGELVKVLNWKIFPSVAFLHAVWKDPISRRSEICRNLIFKRLFLDAELLKTEINVKNCFIIDEISSEFVFLTKAVSDVISEFFGMNLMQIASLEEFLSLSKEKILHLFLNSEIGLCAEAARWDAAIKWMKSNSEEKEIFSELLKCINFDQLSKNIIISAIETDPFVSEIISSFHDVVLRCFFSPTKVQTYVAILHPDGRIYAWNILDKTWRQLPDCPIKKDNIKLFSFRGKLCVLAEKELFYLGRNETKWIPRASLEQTPERFACVAPSNDKIYNVGKERMSCYDPETNAWDERLPGCDLDGKLFAACTSRYLFVQNEMNCRCFRFGIFSWIRKRISLNIPQNGSMTSNGRHDRIYSVGHEGPYLNSYRKANFFNNESGSWNEIEDTPISIKKPSHLFFVDERLILLVGGKFYTYDSVFNTWMTLDGLPLPSYYSQSLGNVKCQEPVAVCSFSGNLEKISPINFSK